MSSIDAYLSNPLWLAPMAGVTDRAFRALCLQHGSGLTCTEMVSAAGLAHGNARTWQLVEPAAEEARLAVQLFGADAAMMAAQASAVAERLGPRLALVDVNMGCPVRKVVKKGEGAALMCEPARAAGIVAALVAALGDVPVTAKFRTGWATGEETAVEFAKRLEQAGAALLSVHGRSAQQMYSGSADWGTIARVKRAVAVPVAGSGDVFTHAAAHELLRQTGADVALVARGARGNPWVFSGRQPSAQQRIAVMRRHFGLYLRYEGDGHLAPLRTQFAGYVRGLPGASEFRRQLSACTTPADFEALFAGAESRLA